MASPVNRGSPDRFVRRRTLTSGRVTQESRRHRRWPPGLRPPLLRHRARLLSGRSAGRHYKDQAFSSSRGSLMTT